MHSIAARIVALGSMVLILGCSSAVGLDQERRIGVIAGFNEDDPRIEAPDTVAAGEPFTVTVTTYGNTCVEKGDTEVRTQDLEATVTPYDFYTVGETIVCGEVLNLFEHTVALTFAEPGTARVIVRGRESRSDDGLAVRREIVVQ